VATSFNDWQLAIVNIAAAGIENGAVSPAAAGFWQLSRPPVVETAASSQ
jgi:hypothetical protein